MKIYRRSVTINGKEKKSPRFKKKSEVDSWYAKKLTERQFLKEGVNLPLDTKTILNDYFDSTWILQREKTYPVSTTYSDRQRYNDYIRPFIGLMRVSKINQLQVRQTLKAVCEVHGMSIETRNRVRALLSKLFNDAMNEDPPLRSDNPALNISFQDARRGKKEPEYIKNEKQISLFLKKARELSSTHYAWASLQLMAGMRKSEAIPLQWSDFDSVEAELFIRRRFMQAANKIVDGTKAGSSEVRSIPIADTLVRILNGHRKVSEWKDENDFILSREDGSNFGPREIHDLHNDIVEHSGVKITPHGLRHTFGREWVKRGGSMKALQTILGHSNSQITDLYSRLAGKSVKAQRNTVSIEVEDDE